ncbi:MAG: 4Fe-4S ferredoxin [Promethearchaeota archaeon]|nr:MAG: 4Fe-4S ferredoxin [Candidatus Lokiarchaeota archaeon]
MNNINKQNQEITNSIRDLSKELIKKGEVDLIIGYSEGTFPLSSSPIFVRREEDINHLAWNNLCYVNLAKYLIPEISEMRDGENTPLKVGVISKGCTARAIIHQAVEKQVNLDNIKIIGINCNGIINRRRIEKEIGQREITDISIEDEEIIVKGKDFEERFPFAEYMNELCKTCKIKAPPMSNELSNIIIGASQEISDLDHDYSDLNEYESQTPDEKWESVQVLLQDCTRCYSCREACPMCYCNLCFVDQNLPTWFGKTVELPDIMVFHMIRALHLAGRCVECGACSSACPIGIDLALINRKLGKIVKERFEFTSGLNLETLPPMMTHQMNDKQEFMLEEDQ